MKLTTKLLKEMVEQEISEMEYSGPPSLENPPPPAPAKKIKYFKASNPVEIGETEFNELVAAGGYQQDDFETGDKTVFI